MTDKFRGEDFKGLSRAVLIPLIKKHTGTECPPVDSINWRISLYRVCLELTQQQFSRRVGIAQATLCEIESGKSFPSCLTIQKIARLKDRPVDIMWLLLGETQ